MVGRKKPFNYELFITNKKTILLFKFFYFIMFFRNKRFNLKFFLDMFMYYFHLETKKQEKFFPIFYLPEE